MARGQLDIVLRHLRNVVVTKSVEHWTDAELVGRFVERQDEATFAVLVRRHGGLVLNVCRHVLRCEMDADDAFQAVFLVLARKAASVSKGTSLASWLHRVALRCALDFRRSAMRRRKHEQIAGEGRAAESPLSQAALNEMQAYLDEEIDRLPDKYRTPFILCCLESKSRAEAAEMLGWKEGTLATRIAKAREILQTRLTARGVTLSAALAAVAISPSATSASVSATLASATTDAALAFLAGNTAGAVSTQVLTLAQGALQGILVTKLKTSLAILLSVSLAVSAAGGFVVGQNAGESSSKKDVPPINPPQVANQKRESKSAARARVDAFGDPLPANAVARLGTERYRVDGFVDQLAVVPGVRQLLVQGQRSIVLFDADTGRELRRFEPPRWRMGDQGARYSVQIACFALSPDKKLLAAGTNDGSTLDCPILLFDFASGRMIGELPGHKGREFAATISLVFLAPTRLVSSGVDHTARVWDVGDRREIQRLELAAEGSAWDLTGSRDEKLVFGVASDKQSSFWAAWDIATGKRIHREDNLSGQFGRLVLSPDGQTIAIAVGVGEPQKDGGWNEARLYSVANFKELRRWKTHAGHFPQRNAIAFAAHGRMVATGGADQKVRIWDTATGNEMGAAIEPYQYANNVAYLDATTLLTFGSQSTVRFWDAKSGRPKFDLVGAESHLTAIAYSPDGRFVAVGGGGGDATVRVWDAAAGKQIAHLRGGMADLTSLQFSPDGKRIVTGDSFGAARLWDWASGKEIRAFRDHKPWLYSVAFSPDGQVIATGDGGGVIRLWSGEGEKPIHVLNGHSAFITSLRFTPDGRSLFSGSWDHSIRQWDLGTAKEARVIKGVQSVLAQEKLLGHTNVVTDLAMSADGRRLFSGSYDHRICVWQVSSGRLCRLLKGQSANNASGVRAIALSPDGKQLAAAIDDGDDERKVHIWDVLTGEKIGVLAGHRGTVTKLAYAPDGKRLASCSTDTTAIVWNVTALQGPRPELDVMPLVQLCHDLDDADPEKGFAAVCGLAAAGDAAVNLLRGIIGTAPRLDLSMLPTLIKQLDDPEFRTREQADQALKKFGLPIEPALRRAMANKPPLEAKRRIERILVDFTVEIRRQDRALEVLELIGTANARTRIAELAKGDPDAFLTRAANEALGRLERAKSKPGSP